MTPPLPAAEARERIIEAMTKDILTAIRDSAGKYNDVGTAIAAARAAFLAGQRAQEEVGWQSVPRVVTMEMRNAARGSVARHNKAHRKVGNYEAGEGAGTEMQPTIHYAAMLTAAPRLTEEGWNEIPA